VAAAVVDDAARANRRSGNAIAARYAATVNDRG
jgi:hypothetical protein